MLCCVVCCRLEQEKLADELHRQCSQSQNTDDYLAGIDLSSSNAQFSELEDPAGTAKEDNVSRVGPAWMSYIGLSCL